MIRTRQLQYAYPGGAVLTFPGVDVPQGTVLLFSGPSGCGKSTWLALVARWFPLLRGSRPWPCSHWFLLKT
jgi:ABC-type sugar transport system ATPase subunit